MIDPYKMVVISLSSFIIVITGLLFYKYSYPKKRINLLLLIIILSLPPIISIFRSGSYESGDFTIHIYRTIEFYRSLTDGIIFPSWAGDLNATYGYPLFIFNYPLPYYFISFFHFIGFSFIASMKVFLAFNFLLSGIFMYICSKKLFKNDIAAFTTSIFYQFAPYHLIDLHFKIVIGEILIFTLAPLTFFFLQKLWEEKKLMWFTITSISTGLLIMSHVVIALFFIIIFFCYAIFISLKSKNIKIIIDSIIVFVLGSLCSIYIWLTPFFMTKYTIFKDVHGIVYYPQIWELLFSPWRLGFLFQGSHGELSFLLGYTHIIIIFTIIVLLFNNKIIKKYKSNVNFWIIALGIIIFFITPYSKFIWDMVPFLKITGSHRLLVLAAFVSSILAGYLILHLLKKRTLILLLILLTIITTILNWGHRRVIPQINDQHLITRVWKSTSEGEGHFYANSQWRNMKNPWFSNLPNTHIEIIKGTADIKELERISTKHTYIIDTKTPIIMKENTLYFPGWKVISNNNQIQSKPDKEGLITFTLPKGLQLVEVKYQDITIYKTLKLISITSFLLLILIFLNSWKRAYER